jgi:hypothetical protein
MSYLLYSVSFFVLVIGTGMFLPGAIVYYVLATGN